MVDVLRIKRRAVGGAAGPPATLAAAEIAFNEQDNTLYYGSGDSSGVATSILPIAGPGAYLPLSGGALSGGLSFGSTVAASALTLTRHISLFGGNYGFSITSGRLNYVGGSHRFLVGASTIDYLSITAAGIAIGGATSGSVTLAVPAVASGTITFPAGTTNFSTTGGTGRVVKQLTTGAALTVAQLAASGLDSTAQVPVLLGTVAMAAAVRGVCVMGNYAYTTNQSTTALVDVLEIFDITIPTVPVKVGGLILPQQGLGQPVVAGNILYTGCNVVATGLQIIDVSNPKAPSLIRSFNAGSTVQYLALSGAYLYVGYGGTNAAFRIYDISDPAIPIQKGAITTMPGASGTRSIVLQGKYAFIGTGQVVAGVGGLLVYDVSDIATPVLVSSSFNCATAVSGLCVAGKYLYIAGATAANGLEVVNIEDPANPVSVKIFALVGVPNIGGNPVLSGNYLYVTTNSATLGLQVINITDPANPSLVGSVTAGASAFSSVLRGGCLYVTANAQLRIYDVMGLDVPALRTGSINTDNIYVDGQSNFNGDIYAMRSLIVGQAGIFSRGPIFTDASEAAIPISAIFGNGLVCVGENAATSPALKRSGTTLQIRLGDDSNYAPASASTPAAGDNSNLIATTAFVTAIATHAVAVTPTVAGFNTVSTTYVMAGRTVSITPATTGRILVIAVGYQFQATAGAANFPDIQLVYGTGTAPIAGAAGTGTPTGNTQNPGGGAVGQDIGWTCMSVVIGLTLATTYWFDLRVKINGTGQQSLVQVNIAVVEF